MDTKINMLVNTLHDEGMALDVRERTVAAVAALQMEVGEASPFIGSEIWFAGKTETAAFAAAVAVERATYAAYHAAYEAERASGPYVLGDAGWDTALYRAERVWHEAYAAMYKVLNAQLSGGTAIILPGEDA